MGCICILQLSYSIASPPDRKLFWHLLCSHAFNDQAQEFLLSGGQVIHGVRLTSEWLDRLEFIWPVLILLNSRAASKRNANIHDRICQITSWPHPSSFGNQKRFWLDWLSELLAPFADREHVEIHVGDNFRALIRPKLKGRDFVQYSWEDRLMGAGGKY